MIKFLIKLTYIDVLFEVFGAFHLHVFSCRSPSLILPKSSAQLTLRAVFIPISLLILMVPLLIEAFPSLCFLPQIHLFLIAYFIFHLLVKISQTTTAHKITFCFDNLSHFFFITLWLFHVLVFFSQLECNVLRAVTLSYFCSSEITLAIILNPIKFRKFNMIPLICSSYSNFVSCLDNVCVCFIAILFFSYKIQFMAMYCL